MNWNAIGAIAGIVGIVVAVYFGLRSLENSVAPSIQPTPSPFPPPLPPPPMPPSPPISQAPPCLTLKLPTCPDNVNPAASDIIKSCEQYIKIDSKNPLAYSLVGRAYRALGRLGEAELAFESQLRLGQSLNDAGTVAQAYYGLATIQLRRGAYDRSEFFVKKSQESINNDIGQAANYKILGDIYYRKGEFRRAEAYFQRSTSFYVQINDKLGLGGAYTGLAFSKLRQRDRIGCQYLQRARLLYADLACYSLKSENERYLHETKC